MGGSLDFREACYAGYYWCQACDAMPLEHSGEPHFRCPKCGAARVVFVAPTVPRPESAVEIIAGNNAMIKIGDAVRKKAGFAFPGIVRCLFTASNGHLMCVVEADHPEFKGMMHIYRADQMEPRP
jgi:DNA-directed RNA polymerase subunit RPC12/RpoP